MANQQHVAILKQGTPAWNTWRQQNPTVTPDLSKGNLRGADLSETDLSRADLSETDLSKADLSEADLPYIIAHSAPPPQELVFDWEYPVADLRNADLSNTNLSRCDLSDCDFSRANLSWVKLTGATGVEWEWADDTGHNP